MIAPGRAPPHAGRCVSGFISLCAAFMLSGCSDYLSRLPVQPIQSSRLRSIESMTLPAATSSSPTSQATSQPLETPKEVRLTLAEVRAKTLHNNLDLAVALLDPTIARTNLSAEEAAFEAVFTTRFDYANQDQPTGSQLNSAQSTLWSVAPGIAIPLRTGGEITLSVPISRSESDNRFNTLNPAYNSDLTISVRQPLLRGAGTAIAEQRIYVSFFEQQRSQAQTKLEVIRVVAEADRAYWRLVAARQLLAVRVQDRDLAQHQLDRVVRQVRVGTVADVERVRAEAGLSDTIEGIIIAETNVRQAQRDLKAMMNDPDVPVGSETIIVPDSIPEAIDLAVSVPDLVESAMAGRMELLDTELALAEQTVNVMSARNATLPLVTLEYTYNVNGLGGKLEEALPTDLNYQDHRVGLQVEIPMGNEAARSRLRGALLRRLQLLSTRQARELTVRRDVLDAVDRLRRDWQRVQAARQRVTLNERLLAAETRQFEQQLRTSTEVLQSQAALADAKASLVSAQVDYQIDQIDVAFATGMTLGAARIDWEPRK